MKNCGVGGGELVHQIWGLKAFNQEHLWVLSRKYGMLLKFFLNITNMDIDSLQT